MDNMFLDSNVMASSSVTLDPVLQQISFISICCTFCVKQLTRHCRNCSALIVTEDLLEDSTESCSKHYVVVHHHMNVASTQVSELAKQSKGGACYL